MAAICFNYCYCATRVISLQYKGGILYILHLANTRIVQPFVLMHMATIRGSEKKSLTVCLLLFNIKVKIFTFN